MRKLANGSGMINRLIGRLAAAKGGVLAVAVTLALIAGAGVGFASLHGSAPTKPAADSAPTATAPGAATQTLEPPEPPERTGSAQVAKATPVPGATPTATWWAGPPPATISGPTPTPSVPQLNLIPVMYIQEPQGCGALSPNYFQNGFTVQNAGGATLTWQISRTASGQQGTAGSTGIQFSTMGGSLAAGQSQYVQMYWEGGSTPTTRPPTGSIYFTITSNGAIWSNFGPDQQMDIGCAKS